jgi:hypothetical protein
MTRHLDLDNPTDEQRLAVQLYEQACIERDVARRQRDTLEKELHINRQALAHAAQNVGKLLRAESALRRIAAQVDLTDPRDPVGAAMTRAGCADVTYGPDDVDALTALTMTEEP